MYIRSIDHISIIDLLYLHRISYADRICISDFMFVVYEEGARHINRRRSSLCRMGCVSVRVKMRVCICACVMHAWITIDVRYELHVVVMFPCPHSITLLTCCRSVAVHGPGCSRTRVVTRRIHVVLSDGFHGVQEHISGTHLVSGKQIPGPGHVRTANPVRCRSGDLVLLQRGHFHADTGCVEVFQRC